MRIKKKKKSDYTWYERYGNTLQISVENTFSS